MNVYIARALTAAVIAAGFTTSAWVGVAIGHAAPHENTVDVSELDFATLPTCVMEDGSDLPAASLPCVWGNQGSAWLTYEDRSLLIVDAKDGNVSDMDLGA